MINPWNPEVKERLDQLILENANQNKKVIFDFDNTVIAGDIGEATFAYLVKSNLLNIEKIKAFSPDFSITNADKQTKNIILGETVDIIDYYNYFMQPTQHHVNDDSIAVNAYIWLVQIMEGLTPYQIVEATKQAYHYPKKTIPVNDNTYIKPLFYPEIVDLIAQLVNNGFDVYFVSASNVWTIRYMVIKELNKLLKNKLGNKTIIAPEKVFGVSTLIKNTINNRLYKDQYLVNEDDEKARLYANLDKKELKNYILTNQPVYPCSAFDGKTSVIMKYIMKNNDRPFLAAGDSPGDYSMLKFSENKIWIARLDNKDYQKKTSKLIQDKSKWFIHPVSS